MFSLKFFIYFAVLFISFGVITARSTSNSTSECDDVCLRMSLPVCVTLQDGTQKDYDMCDYEYESCMGYIDAKDVKTGPCKSISKPTSKCNFNCNGKGGPVCLLFRNGIQSEYASFCEFMTDYCMDPTIDLYILLSGPCK